MDTLHSQIVPNEGRLLNHSAATELGRLLVLTKLPKILPDVNLKALLVYVPCVAYLYFHKNKQYEVIIMLVKLFQASPMKFLSEHRSFNEN